MNDPGLVGYLAIFLGATVLSLVLVPLAMRFAIRHEIFDHPGGYKQQPNPVPYLGGVAIILAFSASILVAAALRPPVSGFGELAVILGCAVALGIVGLADDLRSLPLSPRLAAMVAAAGALWLAGVRVQLFDVAALDLAITLLWVVGITNAFNLLDNMDGLSAGVAAIAASSFFLIAALNGQFLVAALSAALAGCALGFLRHNAHPARIYMGDAGSLFLGFMLAVAGVKLRFNGPLHVTFMIPVIVLGVPGLDTMLVFVTRVRNGHSPLLGARDHASHRLVALGLHPRIAVRALWGAGVVLGWIGLIASRLDDVTAWLTLSLVLSTGALTAVMLARVSVAGAAFTHDRSPAQKSARVRA